MAITKEDLRDFARFADAKVENGKVTSLVDLAGEWESQRREIEETVADIRQNHADIEAGRVSPITMRLQIFGSN
jgi:hypothetical protein